MGEMVMLMSFLEKKGPVSLWLELWLNRQDSFIVCGKIRLVVDISTLWEGQNKTDDKISNKYWTRRKIQHRAARIPVKFCPLGLEVC